MCGVWTIHPHFDAMKTAIFSVTGDDTHTWMPAILQGMRSTVVTLCLQVDVCMRGLRMLFRILAQMPRLCNVRLAVTLESMDTLYPGPLPPLFPGMLLKRLNVALNTESAGHDVQEWFCRTFHPVAHVVRLMFVSITGRSSVWFRVGNIFTNCEQLTHLINCRWFSNTEHVAPWQIKEKRHEGRRSPLSGFQRFSRVPVRHVKAAVRDQGIVSPKTEQA